jgi:hypothetical protein
MTPSSMRGQRNLPPSSRLANRHSPVPSQKISFTLSARFERKQKITPENGSVFSCAQRRKPVHPLTEVHRLRRHENPDRSRRDQHAAAYAPARRTARRTASRSRLSAPPDTRTAMDPITISIEAGRRLWAALFARAEPVGTTGTKAGSASAGSAKSPSLAALIQLDSCWGTRSCRRATSAITAPSAIASATIRPFS